MVAGARDPRAPFVGLGTLGKGPPGAGPDGRRAGLRNGRADDLAARIHHGISEPGLERLAPAIGATAPTHPVHGEC